MNKDLKREIIIDNNANSFHKGLIEDDLYIKQNMNNESCIDEVDLMVKIEDLKIIDIRFDGEACAISTATTSIMIKELIGKSIDEALNIINNYEAMIEEMPYDSKLLGEAVCFDEIYKQPSRKKCALLSWWGLKKILENYQE